MLHHGTFPLGCDTQTLPLLAHTCHYSFDLGHHSGCKVAPLVVLICILLMKEDVGFLCTKAALQHTSSSQAPLCGHSAKTPGVLGHPYRHSPARREVQMCKQSRYLPSTGPWTITHEVSPSHDPDRPAGHRGREGSSDAFLPDPQKIRAETHVLAILCWSQDRTSLSFLFFGHPRTLVGS